MVPEVPVKNCKQPSGPTMSSFPQLNWVTKWIAPERYTHKSRCSPIIDLPLMSHDLASLEPLPRLNVTALHSSEASNITANYKLPSFSTDSNNLIWMLTMLTRIKATNNRRSNVSRGSDWKGVCEAIAESVAVSGHRGVGGRCCSSCHGSRYIKGLQGSIN